MKKLALALAFLTSTSAFAESNLTGTVAKSLFYSLMAQKASGAKIEENSNGSTSGGGYQTSFWTADGGAIQCTRTVKKKATTYTCDVTE